MARIIFGIIYVEQKITWDSLGSKRIVRVLNGYRLAGAGEKGRKEQTYRVLMWMYQTHTHARTHSILNTLIKPKIRYNKFTKRI